MPLTDDTRAVLQAVVLLVNSGVGTDTLTTVEDLDSWYEHSLRTTHRAEGPDELAAVRAIRPVLHDLLVAERDDAARLVNELLAESGTVPQLARHGGWDWHLHG